jgi:hypothetical protein
MLNIVSVVIPYGDDSITGLSRHCPLEELRPMFAAFGLEIEISYTPLLGAEFLSSRIIQSSSGY